MSNSNKFNRAAEICKNIGQGLDPRTLSQNPWKAVNMLFTALSAYNTVHNVYYGGPRGLLHAPTLVLAVMLFVDYQVGKRERPQGGPPKPPVWRQ